MEKKNIRKETPFLDEISSERFEAVLHSINEKRHIGVKVIKAVIRYKLDILFTSQIGEFSFYMLKDSFVDIYKIEEGLSVNEVMEGYFNNRFEKIVKPTHSLEESQSV